MKSIMEEASSIAKAIEKGWERAGKPQDFNVKVYEEAEKNFFGMTTKPAKIGLFFQESAVSRMQSGQSYANKPHQQTKHHDATFGKGQTKQKNERISAASETAARKPSYQSQPQQQPKVEKAPKREQTSSSPWSSELVSEAQEWVKDSLNLMGLSNLNFTVEVDRYALKFQFSSPITANLDKEKMLFRSWAYLIMQALRQRFKRPLKGLKIILMSNA